MNAGDVILVPPTIQSPARLRGFLRFEELIVAHPQHEVFILWFRQDPANPFAVVMRLHKERIRTEGWPLIVDPDSRVVQFNACGPMGESDV